MNALTFAAHGRERKARCLVATLDAIASRMKPQPDAEGMFRFVSGMSDEMWTRVTAIANESHDCGFHHSTPSADTQTEVVNVYTDRAIHADKVEDKLAAEIAFRADRAVRRHMQVMR